MGEDWNTEKNYKTLVSEVIQKAGGHPNEAFGQDYNRQTASNANHLGHQSIGSEPVPTERVGSPFENFGFNFSDFNLLDQKSALFGAPIPMSLKRTESQP